MGKVQTKRNPKVRGIGFRQPKNSKGQDIAIGAGVEHLGSEVGVSHDPVCGTGVSGGVWFLPLTRSTWGVGGEDEEEG